MRVGEPRGECYPVSTCHQLSPFYVVFGLGKVAILLVRAKHHT